MEGDECLQNIHDDKVASKVNKTCPLSNSKDDREESICSGHFKKAKLPRLAQKGKKDWVKELCVNNKVNFISFSSVGYSGGILCVWDPRMFLKINSMVFDYFVMIKREWVPNDKKLLMIDNWNGEVVIMGDFNEVRKQVERYDSIFNVQGADAFNSFISDAGLEEVPLGVCSFTWCHKLATKMRQLDHFIISEDKGEGNYDVLNKHMSVSKSLQELDKLESMEVAQKAKIKWVIEGDENSKYYHGILNKKEASLLSMVSHLKLDMEYPNKLNLDQQVELENNVTCEEIKRAIWYCGADKSPCLDGFTFEFYHRYWSFLEKYVEEAIYYFLQYGTFPKGGNSSFIALIPKMHDAKMVKDFRPITLIGSLYKIIAKILANRLVVFLGDIVNEVQSAFVANMQNIDGMFILNELFHWCKKKKKHTMIFKLDFEKAYDSVRWDYFDDVLKFFGFGDRWCGWIQSCIRSSRGSVLECFYRASGLHINMNKSKLIGISVANVIVDKAAAKISCATLEAPFYYLGSKVGGLMSHVQSWNEIVNNLVARLSNWKMKTLSIGGRLTLLKSVLGLMPIYHMSLLKVPMKGVALVDMRDRWVWSLEGSGESSVAFVQRLIDKRWLPEILTKTRWINVVPIKVNAYAWKV
ncbi:RNA-directed DNA polymerase, eukaryota, reverse transcriptase zinc-binding domain protein, partial [Tanacetum coccineum]